MRVLEPIQLDEPPDQPSYSRSLVMDVAESIRSNMQDALSTMLSERQSIWGGWR